MISILASIALLLGGFFSLVAAFGVYRFRDFYTRIHAATKATSFGVGFSALAAAIVFNEPAIWGKMLLVIVFLFITLPIGAHLLGRAVRSRDSSPTPNQDVR